MDHALVKTLTRQAKEIRKETLLTIGKLGVGHVGGALSIVELLTLLYFHTMRIDTDNPNWEERDKLVLSKGHAGPALYATLALKGFFPISWLDTLNKGGTNLPSHCDRNKTPGVDMSTGSLGQGLSVACGMAYANVLDTSDSYVYAIIGDGESNEGQNWEAAMFASHQKLHNLIAFTDYNKFQIDGATDEILSLGDIEGKWRSFGWFVQRCNGHDFSEMDHAIEQAKKQSKAPNGLPSMIILDTIKGKGAAIAEGKASSHNMVLDMRAAQEAIDALYEEN